MTAEVGLMNRNGVALAADSAVTIGHDARKIYTSAEKLFQLSECQPVAVMVYGGASFVGVPWETIIKTYRSEFGDDKRDSIRDYATHFLSYLRTSRNLFPRAEQDKHVESIVGGYYIGLREQIKRTINDEAEKRGGLDTKDIPPILTKVVKANSSAIKSQPLFKDIDKKTRETFKRRFRDHVNEIRKAVFEALPFSSTAARMLTDSAFELLFRQCFGARLSGLVIAGFGEAEFMPALIHFHIEDMVNNCLRFVEKGQHIVGTDGDAVVMPFAQQDMVHSFMEGIHGELASHMTQSTQSLFTRAFDGILDSVKKSDAKLGDELSKVVQPILKKMLDKLFDDWEMHRREYWRPVVDVVSSLPKDELAAMAEALVNLTSFRRRVTNVPETVGGPIDVAVITKGDGFVWVKRKHYFEPSLNPRIMARYRQTQGDDNG